MLSLRDIIDFASMSEDMAHKLNNPNVGLPDLGALLAGQTGLGGAPMRACTPRPCAAHNVESD